MASKYWIKLYHEILDDHKMGRMPDRLWRRTIELFLIAGEYDHEGILPCFEDIAWRLRTSDDGLMEDLEDLSDVGIIKENDDGRYFVIKFMDRQSPMSNEERGRRFRESHQKQEYNETHYDGERETNETFADKDKIISDIDNITKEEEKDKHMLSQSPHSLALTDDNGELIPEEDNLFSRCQKIYETKIGRLIPSPSSFVLMINNFEENGVTSEDYAAAIDEMSADPKYGRATNPDSFEKWALGIADKRKHPAKNGKRGKPRETLEEMEARLLHPDSVEAK